MGRLCHVIPSGICLPQYRLEYVMSFGSVRYVLSIVSIYTCRLDGLTMASGVFYTTTKLLQLIFVLLAHFSWSSVALNDGASSPSKSVGPKQLS